MSLALQLKPMSTGDILDRAFRIYRQNFVSLVAIAALISVSEALLRTVLAIVTLPVSGTVTIRPTFDDVARWQLFTFGTWILTLVFPFVELFGDGAAVHFVSERCLQRPASVRRAYHKSFALWGTLLIGDIVTTLVELALASPILIVLLLARSGWTGPQIGLLELCALLAIIPGLIFAASLIVRWYFWIPAAVLENLIGVSSLNRSRKLVKGTFWRVAGVMLVVTLLWSVFAFTPIYLVAQGTTQLASPVLASLIQIVVTMVLGILLHPLGSAICTIFYYDLRVRKEGFDLQFQLSTSSEPPSGTLSLTPNAP